MADLTREPSTRISVCAKLTSTLAIANRVAEILRQEGGFSVALTRQDATTELSNSARGAIANACSAEVFVEIHLNASVNRDVNYAQTFWAVKEKDLVFSQVMNAALGALGIPLSDIDRFDNGGLLRAKMPSILVESVFLSNQYGGGGPGPTATSGRDRPCNSQRNYRLVLRGRGSAVRAPRRIQIQIAPDRGGLSGRGRACFADVEACAKSFA